MIRPETLNDRPQVHHLIESAFARPDEAQLVAALHAENAVLLSLVAERDATLTGHILFSRMTIHSAGTHIPAVSLAPVAVLPAHQSQGIGADLIRTGLQTLRAMGEQIVIVLGNPAYYSRFGFSASAAARLSSPFPPEAFMALELVPGALNGIEGPVHYAAAFGL